MSTRLLLFVLLCAVSIPASAYPPAPYHRIYGTVRDQQGNALATGVGTIILSGVGNVEIVRGLSDTAIAATINYSVTVPMDSGTTAVLYQITALRPLLPFTIRVEIAGVSYVPIQASAGAFSMGDPAAQTRIDLTLGIDSDNDGLPDDWEYNVIDSDLTGMLTSLGDINPNDDLDGDGIPNIDEYIAGTYPLDAQDGIALQILSVTNGYARLRFLAIKGRTYRITATSDLSLTPYTQPFSLTAPGPAYSYFLATDVEYRDVFVNSGTATKLLFRLQVQ